MYWDRCISRFIVLILFLLFVAACASVPLAGAPAEEPAAEEPIDEPAVPAEEPVKEGPPPAMTGIPLPTPSPAPIVTTVPVIPNTGGGDPEPEPQPAPAIPESRMLTLEFPTEMKTGDSALVRLTLEMDDRGNIAPTAEIEGNVVEGLIVEIPNLYETHVVVAEARLDIAGMQVQPPGTISEDLSPGKPVTFYWSIRPEDSGKYAGTAWLHLRAIPRDEGDEMRIPISVQFLEIEAKSFMGFVSGGTARGLGAFGSVLGSILGFPFVDDLVKWFWERIRRR